ncbi:hypothetical protein HMPREF1051_0327 [Neisseria sicca VK64]|uniref:Uncharacterized protein n=1 Tax=Neisseria sicca VK64 TaxID=1095748 RepID=I2NVS9_NEISI|nr:hypothetical protein HMPREF1051_0327 [Neisseria sicca VK64]
MNTLFKRSSENLFSDDPFVCSQSSDGKLDDLGAQSRVLFLNLEWTKE